MTARVVFYQLSYKFVNRREDVPENARQVVYYALAIGHHVGVLDCFSSLVEIPLAEYQAWLKSMPEGEGREKLEGVIKWGEIEINRNHVGILLPLFESSQAGQAKWAPLVSQCLKNILKEPALYLMVRKRE